MICVAVRYVVLPNREAEAVELFRRLTGASRQEPGCLQYQVHREAEDPRRFFLYEQYRDEKALADHRASPHFEEYVHRGLFRILESRTPQTLIPLEPPGARP